MTDTDDTPDPKARLAGALRDARHRAGLTLNDVEHALPVGLAVSRATVARWESGDSAPNFDQLDWLLVEVYHAQLGEARMIEGYRRAALGVA